MLKLTTTQLKTKQDLEEALDSAAERIRAQVQTVNDALDRLQEMEDHYAAQVDEATTFIESIHEAQETYFGERSEAWADSDRGAAYRDWADAWEMELEPLGLEHPEPIEEPEFTALDTLRDMPVQP